MLCRLEESAEIMKLPESMRLDSASRRLERMKTRLAVVNSALTSGDQQRLPAEHVDTQLALLARAMRRRAVA